MFTKLREKGSTDTTLKQNRAQVSKPVKNKQGQKRSRKRLTGCKSPSGTCVGSVENKKTAYPANLNKETAVNDSKQPSKKPRTPCTLLSTPSPATPVMGVAVGVDALDDQTLAEILSRIHQPNVCREVLPLVCKRWASVLRLPSSVWKDVHIDLSHKEITVTTLPAATQIADPPQTVQCANRRILHSAIERWLQSRSTAVQTLKLMNSYADQTHSFRTDGSGFNSILGYVAGSLKTLVIENCSDVFLANSFGAIGLLTNLEKLHVTCIRHKLSSTDLDPLKKCTCLQELAITTDPTSDRADPYGFKIFPTAILKLKKLRRLQITSSGLQSIPWEITKLNSLEQLDLSGCGIDNLPQMSGMKKLNILNLSNTPVGHVLCVGNKSLNKVKLEELCLRNSQLVVVPDCVSNCLSLKRLDLSCNLLDPIVTSSDVAKAFATRADLEVLYMRSCHLSLVPSHVSMLVGLEELDLAANQLVDLPDSLTALVNLRRLKLSANQFPCIPQVIKKMTSLRRLEMALCLYLEVQWEHVEHMAVSGAWPDLELLDFRKQIGAYQQYTLEVLAQLGSLLKQNTGRDVVLV